MYMYREQNQNFTPPAVTYIVDLESLIFQHRYGYMKDGNSVHNEIYYQYEVINEVTPTH